MPEYRTHLAQPQGLKIIGFTRGQAQKSSLNVKP